MRTLAIALLCGGLGVSARSADDPWVAMTLRDLQALHDILQQNHPGPVDPENPRYGRAPPERRRSSSPKGMPACPRGRRCSPATATAWMS